MVGYILFILLNEMSTDPKCSAVLNKIKREHQDRIILAGAYIRINKEIKMNTHMQDPHEPEVPPLEDPPLPHPCEPIPGEEPPNTPEMK